MKWFPGDDLKYTIIIGAVILLIIIFSKSCEYYAKYSN